MFNARFQGLRLRACSTGFRWAISGKIGEYIVRPTQLGPLARPWPLKAGLATAISQMEISFGPEINRISVEKS